MGTKGEAPWRLAIELPSSHYVGEAIEEVIPLSPKKDERLCFAGSGNYRNYRFENGKRLSHEIDIRTGEPITHHLAAVHVMGGRGGFVDALATAFMVMGPMRAKLLAVKEKIPVVLIVGQDSNDKDFEIWRSPRWIALYDNEHNN